MLLGQSPERDNSDAARQELEDTCMHRHDCSLNSNKKQKAGRAKCKPAARQHAFSMAVLPHAADPPTGTLKNKMRKTKDNNTTQHNTTQRNATQHNTTQHPTAKRLSNILVRLYLPCGLVATLLARRALGVRASPMHL